MQPTESSPVVSMPPIDGRTMPVRLTIGTRTGRGPVDSAWWPYSYNAPTEFPALVTALVVRPGRVEQIGYDFDLWHSATRKLLCDDVVVRCESFHTVFAHLISIIIGPDQGLLLLPSAPEASDDVARAAMSAAASAAPGDTVGNILGRASKVARQPSSAARPVAGTSCDAPIRAAN